MMSTGPDDLRFGGHTRCTARGSDYEEWGEMPLERERMLRLAQRALHAGKTQVSDVTPHPPNPLRFFC